MSAIFHIFFYDPLLNTLVFLYNTVAFGDLGIAIILLTLLIRLILFPIFHKGAKQQAVMREMQSELKEIREKFAKDKVKQSEEMMALYKKYGVNPFSSILLLVVQIPILLALYRIFLQGLTPESFGLLYGFIETPVEIHHSFLGLIDLSERSILLVSIAALGQYLQGILTLRATPLKGGSSQMEKMGRTMVFVAPLLTLVVFFNLPAAVALYWVVSSAFSVVQQIAINRSLKRHGTLGRVREKSS